MKKVNLKTFTVVQDFATQSIQCYLGKTKTYRETERSLQRFLESSEKLTVTYTHNSLEFGEACEELSRNHCTPRERGTQKKLLQYCRVEAWTKHGLLIPWMLLFLRNVQDHLSDAKRPSERRSGEPCQGQVILFGSMVEQHPISAKDAFDTANVKIGAERNQRTQLF